MDEQIVKSLRSISDFKKLAQLEANIQRKNALTDEVAAAIKERSAYLGRFLIASRTGLDLADLTPAEERIVETVSEYVGVMKRRGKDARRTLDQLRNCGLIEAVERAVTKSKPTQGFQTLKDEHLEGLSYEQIVLDHPKEFSQRAVWYASRTLGRPTDSDRPPASLSTPKGQEQGRYESPDPLKPAKVTGKSNPDWTREEHLLGLDLYMRLRGTSYPDEHPEVVKLSATLRDLAQLRGMKGGPTFRNANGVSMKMLNFRRIDPQYNGAGLPSGSKLEEEVWRDYADKPTELAAAVRAILTEIEAVNAAGEEVIGLSSSPEQTPYWVFVCNPAKWAIDKFLAGGIDVDTWGVRPSDSDRFAPGQLGIVRVGIDRRSLADRESRPPLEPGIYALCEVESVAFPGTGANDSFWGDGQGREPGWPTVRIRYLRGYLNSPLTIAQLKRDKPDVSHLLLNGFQAASFPISADDFHAVLDLLHEDVDELPAPAAQPTDSLDRLAELEEKYLNASPEVKTRTSKAIERGPVGAAVKKAMGYKCQLCAALNMNPVGFLKSNGDPYVEAHHVMPVSRQEVGSLSASNIMTLCANHHRQLHYGGNISVAIGNAAFTIAIDGTTVEILKISVAVPQASSLTEST